MKYQWEEQDIHGGQFVREPKGLTCMIAYDVPLEGPSTRWMLIDIRDGLIVCKPETKTALCEVLNTDGFAPLIAGFTNPALR